jgi:hypothetical protein
MVGVEDVGYRVQASGGRDKGAISNEPLPEIACCLCECVVEWNSPVDCFFRAAEWGYAWVGSIFHLF